MKIRKDVTPPIEADNELSNTEIMANINRDFGCTFTVKIKMHTIDAYRTLSDPGLVRQIIGFALDYTPGIAGPLQEEVDYTLEVRREAQAATPRSTAPRERVIVAQVEALRAKDEEIANLRQALAEIAKSDYTRAATNCAAWKAVTLAMQALNPDRHIEKRELAAIEAGQIRKLSQDGE